MLSLNLVATFGPRHIRRSVRAQAGFSGSAKKTGQKKVKWDGGKKGVGT